MRNEIARLHQVCREKDQGMWDLICAARKFLEGPLTAETIQSLESAIAEAEEYVPDYRKG